MFKELPRGWRGWLGLKASGWVSEAEFESVQKSGPGGWGVGEVCIRGNEHEQQVCLGRGGQQLDLFSAQGHSRLPSGASLSRWEREWVFRPLCSWPRGGPLVPGKAGHDANAPHDLKSCPSSSPVAQVTPAQSGHSSHR